MYIYIHYIFSIREVGEVTIKASWKLEGGWLVAPHSVDPRKLNKKLGVGQMSAIFDTQGPQRLQAAGVSGRGVGGGVELCSRSG